jgi:hypothetical protein
MRGCRDLRQESRRQTAEMKTNQQEAEILTQMQGNGTEEKKWVAGGGTEGQQTGWQRPKGEGEGEEEVAGRGSRGAEELFMYCVPRLLAGHCAGESAVRGGR